jgi:hypothetical protein
LKNPKNENKMKKNSTIQQFLEEEPVSFPLPVNYTGVLLQIPLRKEGF